MGNFPQWDVSLYLKYIGSVCDEFQICVSLTAFMSAVELGRAFVADEFYTWLRCVANVSLIMHHCNKV